MGHHLWTTPSWARKLGLILKELMINQLPHSDRSSSQQQSPKFSYHKTRTLKNAKNCLTCAILLYCKQIEIAEYALIRAWNVICLTFNFKTNIILFNRQHCGIWVWVRLRSCFRELWSVKHINIQIISEII